MPYAKGFGWAAELNLQDCYRKLFEVERGVGYPEERAAIMARNRGILKGLKVAACKDMLSVLQAVDPELPGRRDGELPAGRDQGLIKGLGSAAARPPPAPPPTPVRCLRPCC
jgi:hypothetical protein